MQNSLPFLAFNKLIIHVPLHEFETKESVYYRLKSLFLIFWYFFPVSSSLFQLNRFKTVNITSEFVRTNKISTCNYLLCLKYEWIILLLLCSIRLHCLLWSIKNNNVERRRRSKTWNLHYDWTRWSILRQREQCQLWTKARRFEHHICLLHQEILLAHFIA